MKSFNIDINNTMINSIDIHNFLIKGQRKKAIEFIVNKTNCSIKEAEDITDEIFKLSIKNRDEKLSKWKTQPVNDNTIIIDKNKEFLQQQEAQVNKPKCPTCGSYNIQKMSFTKKATSVLGLGLLSNKIGKTYQCNNCKATW